MTDINVITLTGRLTKDAEVKDTASSKLASFTLAYNTYEYNGETKQKEDKANFIDCKYWGKGVDKLAVYLKKGTQVCIYGDLHQEKWSDSNGNNHSKHTITIRTINIGGNKRSSEEVNTSDDSDFETALKNEFNGSDVPF